MQTSTLDRVTIPAMTSQAERDCYYRLAKGGTGAVIEFGAWRGASTIYIAQAVKDSTGGKAHTYDKFETQKSHIRKIKEDCPETAEILIHSARKHLEHNLGPLLDHVIIHEGKIEAARWDFEPISFILFDAPKRVPAISAVLTNFRDGIGPQTVMAWQDFCHFPSYEIPACLYRLRDHLEFLEAVVPGSTLVFRVKSVWKASQVTRDALALNKWAPEEVAKAWRYWEPFVPAEKYPLFMCGKAMFLCDIGHHAHGVAALRAVLETGDEAVLKKWAYLRRARPDFVQRYSPLFECLPC